MLDTPPARAGLSIGGFDVFSANLLTFIMTTEGWTLLSPGPITYASGFQYEGYAYLGAGMLVLAGVVIPIRLWSILRSRWPGRTWQHLPRVIALLFLATLAVGPTVTAGSRTLLTYDVSWWGPFLAFPHARADDLVRLLRGRSGDSVRRGMPALPGRGRAARARGAEPGHFDMRV